MLSKITPHDVKSFPDPYVRFSRIRLFIITLTVTIRNRDLHISSDTLSDNLSASYGIAPM